MLGTKLTSAVSVLPIVLMGCSSNMAVAPDKAELSSYSTPYSFMKHRLDQTLFGMEVFEQDKLLSEELEHSFPESDFINFRSYVTLANQTHMTKPISDAKAYCEHNGGQLKFHSPIKMDQRFTRFYPDAKANNYIATYECQTSSKHWRISVHPYDVQIAKYSSDSNIVFTMVVISEPVQPNEPYTRKVQDYSTVIQGAKLLYPKNNSL
ncbi:hypothetical protein F0223_23665 [Vibrio coralliilyticus]|uniref:hypothetical protein n=1 Tax=Vibrio TaxID=662 RepID=UPI0012681EBA|nr:MULTISPECIES: hypothetical protein [Vibrio]NOI21203.1 hypothetical protein [Vibrio coralliilyticus]